MKNDLFTSLKAVENVLISELPAADFYLHQGYEVAHNAGRWWEAVLCLENSVGMLIPPHVEKGMLLNLRALMSNPYGLLLNDPEITGKACLNYHNLREGLLSLSALVRFRESHWAKNCGERLVDTIDRRFFLSSLSDETICEQLGIPLTPDPMTNRKSEDPYPYQDATPTTGRAIEGLLEFYNATNSENTFQVLQKAVRFHRENALCADGSAPDWLLCCSHVGHNHSYLGTVRGLLRYALQFKDEELKKTVYLTYKNSILQNNCTYSGFAPHDLGKLRFPDDLGDPLGDHASCADIAYIAFLLGTNGYPELLDDTERFLRARLFRSQIMSGTQKGAWGIYGGYFGNGVVMDVYALIAATLSDIYNHHIETKENGTYVYLLFSGETETVSVNAFRSDTCQYVHLCAKKDGVFFIRIPAWCDSSSLMVTSSGISVPFCRNGSFLIFDLKESMDACISFDLPVWESDEYTMVSRTGYHICWCGDEIRQAEKYENSQ